MNYINRLLAAVVLLLVASPSWAANKCFISEYARLGSVNGAPTPPQIALLPSITEQVVDFTAGATQSAAFNAGTYFIRVWCDTQASILGGTNPTATINNLPIASAAPEYFGVIPGQVVSIIAHP